MTQLKSKSYTPLGVIKKSSREVQELFAKTMIKPKFKSASKYRWCPQEYNIPSIADALRDKIREHFPDATFKLRNSSKSIGNTPYRAYLVQLKSAADDAQFLFYYEMGAFNWTFAELDKLKINPDD